MIKTENKTKINSFYSTLAKMVALGLNEDEVKAILG